MENCTSNAHWFYRQGDGFRHVKDQNSGRLIVVQRATGTEAEISASQPSDCKLLAREHVQCATIDMLTVSFGSRFMYGINGSPDPETQEECHDAVRHLLPTYLPNRLDIHFGSMTAEMATDVDLTLPDGRTYTGVMSESKNFLSICYQGDSLVVNK